MANYARIPLELREIPQWVREHFTYNSTTGIVFYKPRIFLNPTPRQKQWNTRFAGRSAGFLHHGYIRVAVGSKCIYAHQVAFACMTGSIPEEIDHINRIKSDNRWINLREASRSQNAANCETRITSKTKIKGISWSKSNKKWRMDIAFNNKKYHGYYDTIEEAKEAYRRKLQELHGEFGNA